MTRQSFTTDAESLPANGTPIVDAIADESANGATPIVDAITDESANGAPIADAIANTHTEPTPPRPLPRP